MKVYLATAVRLALTLIVGAVALGAVACGDDDKPTLAEYFRQVDVVDDSSTKRIDAVFNGITDENDVQQFRNAFKQFAPILDDVAGQFEDIDAADEAKTQHQAATKALNHFSDKVNEIAGSVDEIDATTPDAFFAAIDEKGFGEADDGFTAACKDLQALADQNKIAVDLDCSDEDDEAAAAIEQTMRDAMAAWNGKDAAAFLAFFTDAGLSEIFGEGEPVAREQVAAMLPEIIGDPPLKLRELTTEADADKGTAEVLWDSAPFLEHIRFAMVQEGGAWKIASQDYIDVDDVPDGTTMINVEARDFSFGVADQDIVAANGTGLIGFNITNAGKQTHHFGLFRLPPEGDAQELLRLEEDIPGLDVAGFTDPIAPGETNRAWVFIEPLEPGRYAMVCFLPDTSEGPEGTPHAFKGMVHEFTVPAPQAQAQ